MKILVAFTLDVPEESLADLCELAALEVLDRPGAREFVQAEAEQYIVSYLQDNGVRVTPIRGRAFPGDYPTGGAQHG